MTKKLGYKVTILLLIFSMLTSVLACGGESDSSPTSEVNPENTSSDTSGNLESAQTQQISAIAAANTEEERKPAIEEVVRQGFTLGLVDENGNQLNPNVPADNLSLTPEDVAAHAAMTPGGHYRTINYVVDTLAEAEIVLASTEEIITLEDFLPDLQDYVNWSFANPADPKGSLGLLIGSGCELEVPGSSPTIDGETMISPLASLMMMADILLGVEEAPPQNEEDGAMSKIMSFFSDDAYANDEVQTASAIEGYITSVKPKSSALLGYAMNEWAKNFIAFLELGNRYIVRVTNNLGYDDMQSEKIESTDKDGYTYVYETERRWKSLRSFSLNSAIHTEQLYTQLFLLYRESNGDMKEVTGIPTSFTLSLISPGNQFGLPLYPDADAELVPWGNATIDKNGHRLFATAKQDTSDPSLLICDIKATKLPSEEPRSALLLASATIDIPFADSLDVEKAKALGTNVDIEKLKNLINNIDPAPWVCTVILETVEDVICGKDYFSDEKTVWWEGCRLNGENHGKCRYYYEDGDIHSEGTYDNGKKDGFYTTYYSRPAGKVNCEAEYEDDELLWEKCYSIDGQVLSEINADGSGKNYYWSGRVQTECNYTSSGAECRTYCDNEAHTLCGEYELDEYGDDVNVRDDCDTMCK